MGVVTDRPRDCLLCRVTSGAGLIGAGAYIGVQGNKSSGYNRGLFYAIAAGFATLGVARLFDLAPFSKPVSKDEAKDTS